MQKLQSFLSTSNVMTANQVLGSSFDGAKSFAASEKYRKDLMFIHFIMFHEGANQNGDYFTREEIENSYSTFVGKPITWEHGQPYIGFITDSVLVKPKDGLDDRWHVECMGVIWKTRYPQEAIEISYGYSYQAYRMSVEMYFADEKYMLGEDLENLIEPEDAMLMGLEKGCQYKGKMVYRVLFGCHGGGVGVVQVPADEDARILAVAKKEEDEADRHSSVCIPVSVLESAMAAMSLEDVAEEKQTCAKEVSDVMAKEDKILVPDGTIEVAEELRVEEVQEQEAQEPVPETPEAPENPETPDVPEEAQEDETEASGDFEKEIEELRATIKEQNDVIAGLKKDLDKAVKQYNQLQAKYEKEEQERKLNELAASRLNDLADAGVKITEDNKESLFASLKGMEKDAYDSFKNLLVSNIQNNVEKVEKRGQNVVAALNLESEPTSLLSEYEKLWERVLDSNKRIK